MYNNTEANVSDEQFYKNQNESAKILNVTNSENNNTNNDEGGDGGDLYEDDFYNENYVKDEVEPFLDIENDPSNLIVSNNINDSNGNFETGENVQVDVNFGEPVGISDYRQVSLLLIFASIFYLC